MKKSEIIFSSILVPIDYILIVAAGLSAYALRYSEIYTAYIREVVFSLGFLEYFQYVAMIAVLWLVIFGMSGVYSMRHSRKTFGMLSKIFLACSTGTLIVVVIFFFSRELFSSRFIILAAWVLSIVYTTIVHLIIGRIQKILYKKGVGIHRIVLIGGGESSQILQKEFEKNSKLGYKVVLWSDNFSLGLQEKIRRLKEKGMVDEIIQSDPNLNKEDTHALIEIANEYHLDFKYAADLLGARRSNFEINTISGIPLVEIKKTSLDGWGKVVKRIFDIVGSIFFLVIFSPVYILIPFIIKLDSRGSIFYIDERVGAQNKKFNLYKFRSMVRGADKMKESLISENRRVDGPLFKLDNDPRVTRVGRFIRRTSIDEFPNFWNVLIGNMSLVGPRPHEPHEVAKYEKHHKKLLNIKPGITGLAQVSGRSTLGFEEEVKLDTLYIETWSLWLDIVILFKTPFVLLKFID